MVSFTNANISDTIMESECPAQPVCNPDEKYRRIDGSCNNLLIPKLGMAFTPLRRVLPNAYDDGDTQSSMDYFCICILWGGGGGTMVKFHQIGANTKKMCAKKSLNEKISLKFLTKLKPRTSKPSKKSFLVNERWLGKRAWTS